MMQSLKSPAVRSGAERTSASICGMSLCASVTAPGRRAMSTIWPATKSRSRAAKAVICASSRPIRPPSNLICRHCLPMPRSCPHSLTFAEASRRSIRRVIAAIGRSARSCCWGRPRNPGRPVFSEAGTGWFARIHTRQTRSPCRHAALCVWKHRRIPFGRHANRQRMGARHPDESRFRHHTQPRKGNEFL